MTWTDCDEAGDYVVPNVFSPRDLPDNMDETALHTTVFSAPEPLGSQGELIVYLSSRRPSSVRRRRRCRRRKQFITSSSPKPLGRSKPNFMWSLLG